MTKIYYSENDKQALNLIENFYWYKYYLKTFQYEIINNPFIQDIMCDDKSKNKIYKVVSQILNNEELNRFIDIFIMLVNYHYDYDCIERTDIKTDLLFVINSLMFGNTFKSTYKSLLIGKYGIDK